MDQQHTETADNLMRSGVMGHCPDCDGDRLLVNPECEDAAPGELACTDCGAAIYWAPVELPLGWSAAA